MQTYISHFIYVATEDEINLPTCQLFGTDSYSPSWMICFLHLTFRNPEFVHFYIDALFRCPHKKKSTSFEGDFGHSYMMFAGTIF